MLHICFNTDGLVTFIQEFPSKPRYSTEEASVLLKCQVVI